LYKARDPREVVMQNILQDIDYAIAHLPLQANVYSVTRWTALALKSRICLFEGTFRKYQGIADYEKYLDGAISASATFIADSPYSIYKAGEKPYRDLFSANNAIAQEIILARDYDTGQSIVHNANFYTMTTTYGMPGINKKVVNSYLKADGTRFTDNASYATMEYHNEMQNRDPRLTQSVVGPGYTRIGTTTKLSPDFSSTTTGYQLIKWVTGTAQDGYNKSYNDISLFRAAEVYLNYAEAKAERGTLTQGDLDISVKLIRDRVNMPNIDMAAANATPDPYLTSAETGYAKVTGANKGVILEIRRERTVELIAEGLRYYDIIRWGEGKVFEKQFLGMYFTPGMNANGYRVYDLDGSGNISALDACLYTTAGPPDPLIYTELAPVKTFLKIGGAIQTTASNGGNILVHDNVATPRTWTENRDYLYPIPLSQIQLTSGAITQNPNW
ncbi:MAG: RagB/SusD family nutrient uptake outer membrane protein, partial [Rikenellaceae bacterium]|nr:RagB/SusD family nutrient uptake outer membrane protein [Rikenellaceae bacterium]